MVATQTAREMVASVDPATGAVRGQFERTATTAVVGLVARARAAQAEWGKRPVAERCALIGKLKKTMLAERDALADAVVRESGKPRVEALFADISEPQQQVSSSAWHVSSNGCVPQNVKTERESTFQAH